MRMRLLCILPGPTSSHTVKHYLGLPPELTGGEDTRQLMGPALFLVIEDWPDGVYLFRYGADGDFVGDTWHRNIEDAKHQADYEYGGAATDWAPVPADVEDAVAFGVARVRQTR